jgi:hypothetical protein
MCVCVSRDSISACWKTPLNDRDPHQIAGFIFFCRVLPPHHWWPNLYCCWDFLSHAHTFIPYHAQTFTPHPTHTHIYIYTYAYTVTNNNITYLYIFTICHISIYITHINAHSDTDIHLLWISWVVNRPPGRSGGLVQLTAGRGDSQRPPAKDGADRGPGTPKYQRLIDIACWILGYFAFFLATSCSFSKIIYGWIWQTQEWNCGWIMIGFTTFLAGYRVTPPHIVGFHLYTWLLVNPFFLAWVFHFTSHKMGVIIWSALAFLVPEFCFKGGNLQENPIF